MIQYRNIKTLKSILKWIGLIWVLMCCVSCTHPAEEDIQEVVSKFYSGPTDDFRTADKNLMTRELASLVTQAIEKERHESQKILQSDYPTDKPHILEGHVFSGLYEGFNSFKILNIKVKGNTALVKVQFTNSDFKKKWTDQVHLTLEDTWKIDNVVFKKNMNAAIHSQDLLKSYIYYIRK